MFTPRELNADHRAGANVTYFWPWISESRQPFYRVSEAVSFLFVCFSCLVQKSLEARARIFKEGSRRLGESRILSFATPIWHADSFCVKKCPCFFSPQAGKQGFKHVDESPSNLLFAFKFTSPLHDMSRVCDVPIVLPKMIPGLIHRIPTRHINHETYRRRHRTVTCSESKFKILLVKTITQGKS